MVYIEFEGRLKEVLEKVLAYFREFNPAGYATAIDQCSIDQEHIVHVKISRYSSSD
jgi:hypothetical protein